jgi:hypothetical protein
MLYKMVLGYFRARLIRMIIASFLTKGKETKNLKKLTVIEYALELFNAYLKESKKNKAVKK